MGSEGNVVALLDAPASRAPGRTALVAGLGPRRRVVTFGALRGQVAGVAGALRRFGFAPGDRAVVMVPMSPELYPLLLGLLAAGGVAVFVDPWIGIRRVAAFCGFAEPRAFIGAPRSHLVRWLRPELRRLPITATTGPALFGLPARHRTSAWLREAAAAREDFPAGPGSPALITFTTGSSGSPKGANRTHGFLRAQHEALAEAFPTGDGDVDMTMFPVFSLRNLADGVTSVIPDMDLRRAAAVDPAAILAQMGENRVSTCTASPIFFDRLAEQVLAGTPPPPSLRRLLTGGAPVTHAQLESWSRAFPGREVQVVYGSTESEPVAHVSLEERLSRSRSATGDAHGYYAGRVVPRLRAKVIPISRAPVGPVARWDRLELPPGGIGELVVAGAHVCRDYYRNPAAIAENKIRDTEGTVWHRMGDTGFLDADGGFHLVGRVHSTVFRDGSAVHAQLVEQAALALAGVRRAAAVGLPSATLGEELVVVVEVAGGAPFDSDVLRGGLRAAGHPVDRVLRARRPLPMDPRHNAKVDYAALRAGIAVEGGR